MRKWWIMGLNCLRSIHECTYPDSKPVRPVPVNLPIQTGGIVGHQAELHGLPKVDRLDQADVSQLNTKVSSAVA